MEDRIYSYTKLTKQNTASSLDTLFLLYTLDTKFTIKEIISFYNNHLRNNTPIIIDDKESLSLTEVFRNNPKINEALNLKKKFDDLFVLMNTNLESIDKNELYEFIASNYERVSVYIETQGILNDTICVSAIILHQMNKYKLINTSFANVTELITLYFCKECLINFAKINDKFRQYFVKLCTNNKWINELNKCIKNEYVDHSLFSYDEYDIFIRNKVITENDVKDVINLYKTDNSVKPLVDFIINEKKDFFLMTDKEFLILYKENAYFTNKYIKYYIINNIELQEKEDYFLVYNAIINSTNNKVPLIKYYDWLNEEEKEILTNFYIINYKHDLFFELAYSLNKKYNLIFNNIYNKLLYALKFDLPIEKSDFNKLNRNKLIKLIKECFSLERVVELMNDDLLTEEIIKIIVKRINNPLSFIKRIINLKKQYNLRSFFIDELVVYDPMVSLPLIYELMDGNIGLCRKIVAYISNEVLSDDFFIEENLELIQRILEKVYSMDDLEIERLKNECIKKLERYAKCFNKKIKIINL